MLAIASGVLSLVAGRKVQDPRRVGLQCPASVLSSLSDRPPHLCVSSAGNSGLNRALTADGAVDGSMQPVVGSQQLQLHPAL